MNIGILGTGFGKVHLTMYKELDKGINLTIFGRNQEKLTKLKEKYDCNITTDINTILDDSTIDLIDVCLPSHMHREYAIKALEQGKHVFIETPLALSSEDCKLIIQAKNRYKRNVYVNNFLKFEFYYVYLYNLNKKGEYGKLKHLNIYRKTPGIWGSLGLNRIHTALMIHEFDFVTWLLGKPDKIIHCGIECDDGRRSNIDANLFYNQTTVHINGNSMMPDGYPFTVGFEAVFEKGCLSYHEQCENIIYQMYSYGKCEDIIQQTNNCFKDVFSYVINHIDDMNFDSIIDVEKATLALNCALELGE